MPTKTRRNTSKKSKMKVKRTRPDVEINLYVSMPPISVRPARGKVLRRVIAEPNPILDYREHPESAD